MRRAGTRNVDSQRTRSCCCRSEGCGRICCFRFCSFSAGEQLRKHDKSPWERDQRSFSSHCFQAFACRGARGSLLQWLMDALAATVDIAATATMDSACRPCRASANYLLDEPACARRELAAATAVRACCSVRYRKRDRKQRADALGSDCTGMSPPSAVRWDVSRASRAQRGRAI